MTATEGFIAVEADRAHADAPTFIALEHWTEAKTPMFDGSDQHPARVWRRGKAVVVEGGPAPFKTQGVVVGVSPQVLAVMLTDIAMKDHERHKAPHERNTEREMVQQVDPQTKVWWEVDNFPWPLAAREMLYVERWVATEGGNRVIIARTSIEMSDKPTARGRVRARAFVVTELQQADNGTEMALHLEFNVGGNIPGRLVDGFLSGQSHTFRNLSRLVASEDGKRRIAEAEQQLLSIRLQSPGSTANNGLALERQSQQQQQQQQQHARPSTVSTPSAGPQQVQPHNLSARFTGRTILVFAAVSLCGLVCGLYKRALVWPQISLATPKFRRIFARLESLLGPGWVFYLAAVGSGTVLIGDMAIATPQTKESAVNAMTSRYARSMQIRRVSAFWQNLHDYRVSYGAPLIDTSVMRRRVDDNGFQLPVAASKN